MSDQGNVYYVQGPTHADELRAKHKDRFDSSAFRTWRWRLCGRPALRLFEVIAGKRAADTVGVTMQVGTAILRHGDSPPYAPDTHPQDREAYEALIAALQVEIKRVREEAMKHHKHAISLERALLSALAPSSQDEDEREGAPAGTRPSNLEEMLGIDLNDPSERLAEDLTEDDAAAIDKLVSIRETNGVSQELVAERMSINVKSVRLIESFGSDIRPSTRRRYAHAIGARIKTTVTPWEV